MNQSFEDLVSELAAATPSLWDATPLPIAVPYHSLKEIQKKMHKPTTDYSEIVLAGVHACTLATFVLNTEYPSETEGRVMHKCAHLVLDAWGMGIQGLLPKENPSKETAAPTAPQHLVWPPVDRLGRPLVTTLPDVYRENYYHVHEQVLVDSPTDARFSSKILPDHKLVLANWYWNEETLQWRMKFTFGEHVFWLNHCQVKPGDEIPKIIDGDTQARSNDP